MSFVSCIVLPLILLYSHSNRITGATALTQDAKEITNNNNTLNMTELSSSNSSSNHTKPSSSYTTGGKKPSLTSLRKLEQEAMLDLYNSCHGPSWSLPTVSLPVSNNNNNMSGKQTTLSPKVSRTKTVVTSNWGSGDVCTWYGIRCNPQRRVMFIDLEQPTMQCTLPDSFSILTDMVTFDIAGGLIGTIPSFMRSWKKLQHLKLYQNMFTGTLPEWLPELKHLREFAVVTVHSQPRPKGLTGTIPETYGMLPLKIFVVDNNELHGVIPHWVFRLPFYRLRGNKFTGPCEMAHATNAGIFCQFGPSQNNNNNNNHNNYFAGGGGGNNRNVLAVAANTNDNPNNNNNHNHFLSPQNYPGQPQQQEDYNSVGTFFSTWVMAAFSLFGFFVIIIRKRAELKSQKT